MSTAALLSTAQALMAPGKGLLAMDESPSTCGQRFADAGIPSPHSAEMRLAYRRLLVTTPGLAEGVSGAILHDETIRQSLPRDAGRADESFADHLLRAGVIPGVKVDLGPSALPMSPLERMTQGLDGLPDRAREYARMGARFAKWRAVFAIGPSLPTLGCIAANANALALYAAICQDAGLVPIVEPEVLIEGDHDLARSQAVAEDVLLAVFQQLRTQKVLLEAAILKPSMVLPGIGCAEQPGPEQVAQATWRCLRRSVPAAVAGVAFLSGGQPDVLATQRLNAIAAPSHPTLPWPLTFSFARALQHPVLLAWAGKPENVPAAQQALLRRVRCNAQATRGLYAPAMEAAPPSAPRSLHAAP